MLNKVFKHGTGGGRSVFNYMLKDPDNLNKPRQGATVLRGDAELQEKLIDSLMPKFKQQYVSGCWSFEESPEQVTDEQKREIMDGTEELIKAGLDDDRVSIVWIEHTDKGRLELNYIVACVDLKYGRLFQPYVDSHDQTRWNAFKDIQNIKHGFTEPDDPAKARNLTEADNLPSTEKELKQVITTELEKLVALGVVNNRDDVKQALIDFGFPISRSGSDYISVVQPNGKRNLKFRSAKEGGLYDINFNASAESAAEISRASADFRERAAERFESAQRVYDKELERKRDYHKARHGEPTLEQRTAERNAEHSHSVYEQSDERYAATVQNSDNNAYRNRNNRYDEAHDRLHESDDRNDRSLHSAYADTDSRARASADRVNQVSSETGLGLDSDWLSSLLNSGGSDRSNDSEISNRLTDLDISARPIHEAEHLLSRSRIDEQRTDRADTRSIASSEGYNRTSEANYRMERAGDSEKEQRYSSVDSIITSISSESIARAKSVTISVSGLKKFNEQNNDNISELVASAERATRFADKTNRRADQGRKQTNSTDESIDKLSARHDEFRRFKVRRENVRSEVERYTKDAESREQRIKRLERDAERNRTTSKGLEQVTTEVRSLISDKGQIKQQQVQAEIERQTEVARQVKAEQDKQAEIERQLQAERQAEQERSRSSSPRPF